VALPDSDGGVGHSFGLELDGVEIAHLREVTGLKMEQDVVELKQNDPDGRVVVRKLPGRWKSPEVTLTRGLTADAAFADWVKEAQHGQADGVRRGGAIKVFDLAGALVTRYAFTNAWPKSLEVTTLDAGGTPTLLERLVIVCEHLEPE
jgi:phage tail-like protein